ncbi:MULTISPECIES: DUF4192 domain-containing protein [unclassified Luteococcus]|uniref:DUF4192 domain-containing protein n=1 Tax=unclassified Luteococcus TaxID=2639923 RepID=UPI00313BE017
MSTETADLTRLAIHDSEDFLSLIPYLLGYQPEERLVFLVIDGRRVGMTGALPLAALEIPENARQSLLNCLEHFDRPRVVLACWSANPDLADEALAMAEIWAGPERILDSVSVVGDHWHSRSGEGEGRRGRVADLAHSSVAAQAVVAGLVALPSRDDAVAVVAGPGEDCPQPVERWCLDAEDELRGRPWSHWDATARRLYPDLLAACREGRPVDPMDLARLAVLSGEVTVLDDLLLGIGRRTAKDCARLWAMVVAQTPDDWAHGPLMLLGIASWVTGEGAVMVACIERARRINRSTVWINTLDEMNHHAVNPQVWEQLRAEGIFGVPLPEVA